MARLDDVSDSGQEHLSLSKLSWLDEAIGGGLVKGGTYLLAGEPGIGKTTLALQILGDIALRGMKVLYITTEQGLGDIKRAVRRVLADSSGSIPKAIQDNFLMDDSIADIDDLPRLLDRRILPDDQEYHGTHVIVIDSIQGRGTAPAATKKYRALYDFTEMTKRLGIVSLLVGHVTKRGQIAGPKDLEHNVDCVIYIRRAFRLRPLFIPKNRFAQAVLDPLVLVMDGSGLIPPAHTTAKSAVVLGYGGIGDDLAEGQASVSLPRYGMRAELNAPFLPGKKVKQLLSILSTLKDVDLADLSYEINCYVPRNQQYRSELDLPLAVALLSSYLQRSVEDPSLFVGELDLTKRIRRPEPTYLAALAELISTSQRGRIKRIFLSDEIAHEFGEMRPDGRDVAVKQLVDITGVRDLDSLLRTLWPDLFEKAAGKN